MILFRFQMFFHVFKCSFTFLNVLSRFQIFYSQLSNSPAFSIFFFYFWYYLLYFFLYLISVPCSSSPLHILPDSNALAGILGGSLKKRDPMWPWPQKGFLGSPSPYGKLITLTPMLTIPPQELNPKRSHNYMSHSSRTYRPSPFSMQLHLRGLASLV